MTLTETEWKKLGESLASWYGLEPLSWLSEAWNEPLRLGTVAGQLALWGLNSSPSRLKPHKVMKARQPFFGFTHSGELLLVLPPAREKNSDWRVFKGKGEEQRFANKQRITAFLRDHCTESFILTNRHAARPSKESRTSHHLWFWSTIWRYRRDFLAIVPLSLLINFFALAMPLFIMNVYDRVIPNDAEPTLWVLTSGVAAIFGFEFLLRILRGSFVDAAGKSADRILSNQVFSHVVDMELSSRPASAGNLAGQARGYETVREFLSSLSLVGLIDFPFALLMFGLVFWLGGELGWIPVLSTLIILAFLCILQPFLSWHSRSAHRDRLHRQSLISETANGIESIKAVNAGETLKNRMADLTEVSGRTDLRLRRLTQLGSAFTTLFIHLTTIAVIVLGSYLIGGQELSMGGLIACVMIVSRGMAPLSQISLLLLRLQSVRSSLQGLDEVISLQQEEFEEKLYPDLAHPEVRLVDLVFRYSGQPVDALSGVNLRIIPGEKAAIVGRAGSGKTTLLRILNRQLKASSGLVLINGLDASQIAPDSIRRAFGYLPQDGVLLSGTVKDNITLGTSYFSDEEIVSAARDSGVLTWTNRHPSGLDMEVGERGVLLSGGQRQTVLIARTLLRNPRIFLFDEPTNSLDLSAEKRFQQTIQHLLEVDPDRTLILATHKMSMLNLVDRVILLEGGKVVLDGPRNEVMRHMRREARVNKTEEFRSGQ